MTEARVAVVATAAWQETPLLRDNTRALSDRSAASINDLRARLTETVTNLSANNGVATAGNINNDQGNVAPAEAVHVERVDVQAVPGAYLLKHFLTPEECATLAACTEQLVQADTYITDGPSVERSDNFGVQGSVVGLTDGAEVITHKAPPTQRRAGTSHTPCMMPTAALASLCARLRPYLPPQAGPKHAATLAAPGAELSPFLRCYSYGPGMFSGLHYDKSQTEHEAGSGHQVRLTAYSLLLYLKGHPHQCVGGRTLFYPSATLPRTASGKGVLGQQGVLVQAAAAPLPPSSAVPSTVSENAAITPPATIALSSGDAAATAQRQHQHQQKEQESSELAQASHMLGDPVGVDPSEGDVLIFPHGRQAGCHPDPLHEGELVRSGRKTIIRTDVVFANPPPRRRVKSKKHKLEESRTKTNTVSTEVSCSSSLDSSGANDDRIGKRQRPGQKLPSPASLDILTGEVSKNKVGD